MTFREAKKLHNEDEVLVKGTSKSLHVVDIEVESRNVFIRCDDGKLYHHTALR